MSALTSSPLRRGAFGARGTPARFAAAIGVAALASTACAHARPGGATPPATAAGDSAKALTAAVGPIPVEIDNRSSLDAVVYAVRGSIRQRLGTVAAVSRLSAVLPSSLTDDRGGVAFQAHHLAGNRSFTTDRIVPQPGERLVLTLQTRLDQSTVEVR